MILTFAESPDNNASTSWGKGNQRMSYLQMAENALQREASDIWVDALVASEMIFPTMRVCAKCFSIPRRCIKTATMSEPTWKVLNKEKLNFSLASASLIAIPEREVTLWTGRKCFPKKKLCFCSCQLKQHPPNLGKMQKANSNKDWRRPSTKAWSVFSIKPFSPKALNQGTWSKECLLSSVRLRWYFQIRVRLKFSGTACLVQN